MEQEVNMIHCLSVTLSMEVSIIINAFEFKGHKAMLTTKNVIGCRIRVKYLKTTTRG